MKKDGTETGVQMTRVQAEGADACADGVDLKDKEGLSKSAEAFSNELSETCSDRGLNSCSRHNILTLLGPVNSKGQYFNPRDKTPAELKAEVDRSSWFLNADEWGSVLTELLLDYGCAEKDSELHEQGK